MAEVSQFGTTAGGVPVQAITLRAGPISATVLTFGAVLQDVRLAGVAHGLTLGSDDLADYEGAMRHHGSVIGPVVNRICGAQAQVGGQLHRFEANQDGRICLHSGAAGSHRKVWDLVSASDSAVTLAIDLPDGEGGFPGNRRIEATYEVATPGTLRLRVVARTDALTLMNIANHSYWNLDGSAQWSGHRLRVAADAYLPTTADFTPTGVIEPVAGGPMDFRTLREITVGRDLFDNCFCLSQTRQRLRDVLWLHGASGVSMVVATTEPGVQVYDGRNAVRPGRGLHEGLAIETQLWPDATNHPVFPPITLKPAQGYDALTEWRFAKG